MPLPSLCLLCVCLEFFKRERSIAPVVYVAAKVEIRNSSSCRLGAQAAH